MNYPISKIMKTPLHLCLVLQVICLASHSIYSQTDWDLRKDKDGIQVYTRSIEGSKLEEFKGIAKIDASVDQLVSVLKDVNGFKDWIPDCELAKLYSLEGDVQVHYIEMDAPFPVSNRDSYYQFTYSRQGKNVKVHIEALPRYGPEKDGLVRIPYVKGFWLLESIGPNTTKLTYQVHASPGGSIPAWLANSFVVNNPFDTIENLRSLISGK